MSNIIKDTLQNYDGNKREFYGTYFFYMYNT